MRAAFLLMCFCLALAPSLVSAATRANATYGDHAGAVWVRCYDGDTCTFDLPGIHPLLGRHINVRLRGIDTPEIRGRCQHEQALARRARDRLGALLRSARRVDLRAMERGKYFRIVATVVADGRDAGAVLVAEGLARPYNGGRRRGWCT